MQEQNSSQAENVGPCLPCSAEPSEGFKSELENDPDQPCGKISVAAGRAWMEEGRSVCRWGLLEQHSAGLRLS